MCSPLRLLTVIHKATAAQWTAFSPDWTRYRIRGLVFDQRDIAFDTCLELLPGEPCVLSLRTDILGPFSCQPLTCIHLLAQACTVTRAAFALPNGHDAIVVQATALHAPVQTGLGLLAMDVFRRFRNVLNSHGVQTLLSMSLASSNGLDVRPWDEHKA